MLETITLNNSMLIHTNMKEKQNVKELFFNNASRHWHFEEIVKESKLSRAQTSKWLKKLQKEGIISRIKTKGKMPHYTGNFDSPQYKNSKKLYALKKFYETGLLNHLQALKKAETIVIFGSFARADWHEKSDIDIFIYGDDKELQQGKYESKLKREMQVFTVKNSKGFGKINPELLRDIATGYIVKGNLEFMEVRCRS